MFEELIRKTAFWSAQGPYTDTVLSTRIRLARNISSVHFPAQLDASGHKLLYNAAARFLFESSFKDTVRHIDLATLSATDRRLLRERNIITGEMENSPGCSIILDNHEAFEILINEEDHFRIQVIKPGLQIEDAYRLADRIDEELNRIVPYAFSDEFGYLTSCPSNLGTGLRVSVMTHIPALSMGGSIPDIKKLIHKMGFSIKGTTGAENRTIGSMYIIANRISLGISEIDILEELDEITGIIIDEENNARDEYVSHAGNELEDRVWRSYGILKYARSINFSEAMEHLSIIRLGIILSVIKDITMPAVNDLMVRIQRSHLQKMAETLFADGPACDAFRARFIRERLAH